jgi:UDP-N-acetylglucosamine 2-epimerase (non-hydrolysing)
MEKRATVGPESAPGGGPKQRLTLLRGQGGAEKEPENPRFVFAVTRRPDIVALAPVAVALQRSGEFHQIVLHADECTDATLTDDMFIDLGLPRPEYRFPTEAGSDGQVMARALAEAEAVLARLRPAALVVAGASNTALGCALAATKLAVPVARLDAGLRVHDWRVPEEVNRVLLDTLADLHFAPTREAAETLFGTGIGPGSVYVTGSTAVDSVWRFRRTAVGREVWSCFGLERGTYVLVSLHSPANLDDDERLARIVEALAALAAETPVVFPLHPGTRERLAPMGDVHRLLAAGVLCEHPLGYIDFLSLEAGAGAIVTDSGTVQEEASALGVPCFTLLASTERTITLTHGTNVLLGDDPRDLVEVRPTADDSTPAAIPLWDGHAGQRVADALIANYGLVRATGVP